MTRFITTCRICAGLASYGRKVPAEVNLQDRVFRDRDLQQLKHLFNQARNIDRLGGRALATAIDHQLMDDFPSVKSRSSDPLEFIRDRRTDSQCQYRRSQDSAQQVIKIERYPPGQHAHALKLLSGERLLLGAFYIGDIDARGDVTGKDAI